MTEGELYAAMMKIRRGFSELRALCAGRHRLTSEGLPGRDFVMTIPVRPDDSDIVLHEALKAGEMTIEYALERLKFEEGK